MIPQSIDNHNLSFASNKAIAVWIRFLRHLGLPRLFAGLTDQRQSSKIIYSNTTLALWAFSTYAFRQGSKNAFKTSLESSDSNINKNMSEFLGIKRHSQLPHSKTIDGYLRDINTDELNNILMEIFSWGVKSKLFYNHSEFLSPDNAFLLCCDGFWTHTYTKPHALDEHGHNSCPYCLPRKRHADTPNEETYWVHVLVTVVAVFPGGFKLPLYVYGLKNNQVDGTKGHDAFKQECELKAVHAVLPIIRARFPRTAFIFGGDALYANEPFIQLCDSLHFDYLIVRKDNTLKKLGKHCDELAKTELYQKAYTSHSKQKIRKQEVLQNAQWFNHEAVGESSFTNVLRYEENLQGAEGVLKHGYKGEWISAKPFNKQNCFHRAKRARMRWEHEDLHNTCKNRGFEAKHDMARADPNLWLVWKLMMFIAFAVFELFRFSKLAQEACGNRSWMKFARDLLQQLVELSWDLITSSPILQKSNVQFRFSFSNPP